MNGNGYLIGYDIGSSSIKATLLESETGKVVASAISPEKELEIIAQKTGWAEQHPNSWWEHVKKATAEIRSKTTANLRDVKAIGISYQMHGLVLVDDQKRPLRPSIIWCDSRAVDIGNKAFSDIGNEKCLSRLLNSPGNFTASKLKWVKDNEPEVFNKIFKIMLPGDYIAMKLTGEIATTPSGLSEGIMWDFQRHERADFVLDNYGIPHDMIPSIAPTFSIQGGVLKDVADELGLSAGTPIAYRAGDQPNNALSLNVLNPGEIAATAGTSGVVYGVTDLSKYDPACRVNTFVHVNYLPDSPRYGILLCVNGTGILNRWMRATLCGPGMTYDRMNNLAQQAPAGCDGLLVLPYGNGAERTLENRAIQASINGINFSVHTQGHLLRAAQEGIVFALRYGLDVMREMGVSIHVVRAGHANMFQSPLFAEVFATSIQAHLELYNTDGSQGAARGAGVGAGLYKGFNQAFSNLKVVNRIQPNNKLKSVYDDTYGRWKELVAKS
jgi:xylulokinase